jgi:hypothetical protein
MLKWTWSDLLRLTLAPFGLHVGPCFLIISLLLFKDVLGETINCLGDEKTFVKIYTFLGDSISAGEKILAVVLLAPLS